MAIDCYGLKNIKNIIDTIFLNKKGCNVLLLGYADILLTKQELQMFLTENNIANLISREDSINIAAMYNKEELVEWCCETYSLFENLGCNLSIIDFASWTGKEEIVDLNKPVDSRYNNRYDLIIDSGTTEHIFNVSQVMSNILNMLNLSGYICHITPFNDPNHGFYSFSPTFYKDFYEDNGGEIISCSITQADCNALDVALPTRETFKFDTGMNFVVARKNKIVKNIVYPIQGRYKTSSHEDIQNILEQYNHFTNIILIPFNGQSRNLNKILQDKNSCILDDNEILIKYSITEPISSIVEKKFDIVLITSITFEERIRERLRVLGVHSDKIKLQY